MKNQQNRSSSYRKHEVKGSKEVKQPSPRKNDSTIEEEKKFITLGICAMKKKVQSKPMRQILKRIACNEIKILQMWQYLQKPYRQWPVVPALICFYSQGFPYLKAWKYVKKYKPFLINDLQSQQLLWDRTAVYDILKRARIPVAKHYMIFQDLNYIDEIQMKRFYGQGQRSELSPLTPMLQNSDSFQFRLNRVESQNADVNNKNNNNGSNNSISQNANSNSNGGNGGNDNFNSNNNGNNGNENDNGNGNVNENGNSQKANGDFGLAQRIQQKQFLDKPLRLNNLRKQTVDSLCLNQTQKYEFYDKIQKSDDIKQVLTAKRQVHMHPINGDRPNTLRKFHQQRLHRLQNYEIQQIDDQLLIKSKQTTHKLKKPFVQKPMDAQNHQICIYYPDSMGGGRKMLFRKVKNSSSMYQANQNRIRRDANYIYEEYLPNNAFDIKVYTIGEFYMYAEARKSPTLDGVVQRDQLGKEKRFPIILTPEEKFIAKKIVHQFGQEVCGFDLLRANGKSYVCDVNGWSFVKSNSKYWIDCAKILQKKIFLNFFPHLIKQQSKYYQRFIMTSQNSYLPPTNLLTSYKQEQLRSIVSIFRHGDRSPKLKLKFKSAEPKFIQFFSNSKEKEIKIKDANGLTKLLETTLEVIGDNPNMKAGELAKLGQMKTVLEAGGHFQGLNRKCQMKVMERDSEGKIVKVLIVFKWGGELSTKGFNDSVELGKKMRMEKYNDDQDFLSLHSSYRHDLKTYSSDEGRCIKTAASFLKGFLNIDGGLAPIITSMVMTNKKAQQLLDCTSEQNHSSLGQKIVRRLSDMLNSSQNLVDMYEKYVNVQEISPEMFRIMKQIGCARQKLKTLHKGILELTLLLQNEKLSEYYEQNQIGRASGISGQEEQKQDLVLIYQRWSKLQKDFYSEDEMRFNISKIPEIYDTIRHDLSKNCHVFSHLQFDTESFMSLAKLFAYFVVSNEYGITNQQKIETAQEIASPLLEKILADLMFWKVKQYEDNYWKYQNNGSGEDWKHIRTRLYFTSASHIYSVLHLLTLGNNSQLLKATPVEQAEKINTFVYMSYLSHIQFRLYENLTMKAEDPNRFRVELSIYPDYSKGSPIQEGVLGANGFTIDQIKKFITSVIKPKADNLQRISSKTNDIDDIQKKLNREVNINIKSDSKINEKNEKEKKKNKKKKKDSSNQKD